MSRSGSAYIYDPATLVLDQETITYGNGLSRNLDRAQDNLLRPAGFELITTDCMSNKTKPA